MHRSGDYTTGELAELFDVARATVYRALKRGSDATSADLALPRTER
nr:helix-turn-helix domain-containing protein [Curtobacterium flaccumfaciens]